MDVIFTDWIGRLKREGYAERADSDADLKDQKWYRIFGDGVVLEIYLGPTYTRIVTGEEGLHRPQFSFSRYIAIGDTKLPKTGYYVLPYDPMHMSKEEVEDRIFTNVTQAPV
ncbi:hypothetical protein A2765_04700 [Candidatus Kaiserbacteria bacterium RIFCSPHIGHO2_01_FULL_56_24]|uniref:Uncharacterized protein n=1 Tax=Candidatus Kaiserbacteria bacterium RIFCSPHIGHO2_01_FULL_56_24 TaxID=1798487 RepID=A0A1F6DEQ9_9BACT|nr:MAG: hypothetical protein A2765_04700 [Candidatus Kaiserbacteria bacterium RIFCSPHIGHO2_01_FULL_56_24]